jgi:nicotinamidase/pyrazinamidase
MKNVYFDVDTQIDFVYPAGALYVPGAERILDGVAGLNRHAAATGSPLVSTMDAHLENDPEFRVWPAHCVAGTVGQQKPASTLLGKRLVIPPFDSAERIDEFQQLLLEKRHNDCFTNPNLEGLLLAFDADRYVVYGVVTEICVKYAALGLLERGKNVELVTDAVCALKQTDADAFLSEFTSRGGRLTTAAEVTHRSVEAA